MRGHEVGGLAYSPLFRGMLFGTWSRERPSALTTRAAPTRITGPAFHRHLEALEELQAIARSGGLSCAQLSVGVLLATPGLTGVILAVRAMPVRARSWRTSA